MIPHLILVTGDCFETKRDTSRGGIVGKIELVVAFGESDKTNNVTYLIPGLPANIFEFCFVAINTFFVDILDHNGPGFLTLVIVGNSGSNRTSRKLGYVTGHIIRPLSGGPNLHFTLFAFNFDRLILGVDIYFGARLFLNGLLNNVVSKFSLGNGAGVKGRQNEYGDDGNYQKAGWLKCGFWGRGGWCVGHKSSIDGISEQ